jgi:hypothetical protein
MKKGVVVLAGLALALAFCVPAVAQPSAKAVETIVIDNFDTADQMDWTWKVQASRFASKDEKTGTQYPVMQYFDGIPNSLRPYHKDSDPAAKVLGVKVKYDRKGDNWLEIYPESKTQKDASGVAVKEIPFVGTVTQIDFWVWGANYLYYLEILVRDADGRVHVIPAGNLQFSGWRNVVVNVPGYIRQHSKLRSGVSNMSFVGFRINSDINEFVDDYVVYFDQLKYTTNTLSNIYDGYELKDSDFGDGSASSKSDAASEK